MAEVIAGLLEKDVNEIARKAGLVAGVLSWVQIDVADNTLVPTATATDFRLMEPTITRYRKFGLSFEAHLMVSRPETYLAAAAEAGFSRVIAHVESDSPREFLAEARSHDMEVGLAIDADSDFEQIEPFLEEIDFALVMTSDAGASGQAFRPETVEKIRVIHRNLPDLPIEVDCGMNPETAAVVREAGAIRIVSTSYLFKDESGIAEAAESLAGEDQTV
jgi:ribulose-phosphate 3-epimerase